MSASPPILDARVLGRATLARQGLLARWRLPVSEAIERLVGLQAQAPLAPYHGLWSRLEGFRPETLGQMIERGEAVRIALMRSTIHLVTAGDALGLRPLAQPALDAQVGGSYGRALAGLDRAAVVSEARALLEAEPLATSELGRRLASRFGGRDPRALASAVRCWLPLAQVPPRGVWGKTGPAVHRAADAWLGRPFAARAPEGALEALLLRYLAAFGPATVGDARQWSGLRRLEATFEALRPRLATFRDAQGRELFDLPDAPRPGPEVPAPARFLAEFDNLLLAHADRSRVLPAKHAPGVMKGGMIMGAVLLDGTVAGSWKVRRAKGRGSVLEVRLFRRVSRDERRDVEGEAARLAGFTSADGEPLPVELALP